MDVPGSALAVDYGTSHTVAMVRWADGRTRPLLFDSSPTLPSAVYAADDGRLLVGTDATRAARFDPGRFEPNPKRRIDEAQLFLGDRSVPLVDAVAATLRIVLDEAVRTTGDRPGSVTLTHPAGWGPTRRGILAEAAARAGLGPVRFVPEPVAAATYFAAGATRADPRDLVVYDLGGGTCDVSVIRTVAWRSHVLESDGIEFGGVDLDWLVLDQIAVGLGLGGAAQWAGLVAPATAEDRRTAMLLREDARMAKETLSRQSTAGVHVPALNRDVHVAREAFERAAAVALAPTAALTLKVIRQAGTAHGRLSGLYLVGGSTRVPAVATVLHRATGVAPTVLESPETIVAEGALGVDDDAVHGGPDRPAYGPAGSPPPAFPPMPVAPAVAPIESAPIESAPPPAPRSTPPPAAPQITPPAAAPRFPAAAPGPQPVRTVGRRPSPAAIEAARRRVLASNPIAPAPVAGGPAPAEPHRPNRLRSNALLSNPLLQFGVLVVVLMILALTAVAIATP